MKIVHFNDIHKLLKSFPLKKQALSNKPFSTSPLLFENVGAGQSISFQYLDGFDW